MASQHNKDRRPLIVLIACVVCGCGGGGGTQTAGIDGSGAPVAGQASGSIVGFGSIIVYGTHYSTSSAAILIDGEPGTEAQLAVGHTVFVTRTADNVSPSVATAIEFEHDIEGPVDSVVAASTLVVAGQTVQVDATTAFGDSVPTRSLVGLARGDLVKISGLFRSDGSLLAGRIERGPAGTPLKVHGIASDVNTASRALRIGGLAVSYAAASVNGFPRGEPRNGDFVEVRGTRASVGSTLQATLLQHEARSPLRPAGAPFTVQIQGLVTRYGGPSDFEIDGQAARIVPQTAFRLGTATDLRVDARVAAVGNLGTDGVLTASSLVFEPNTNLLVHAPVTAVDATAGTIVALGTTIRVAPETRLEDRSGGERNFTLADIVVGDWLRISGYGDPDRALTIVATHLERTNDDDDGIELVGPIRALADPEFTILGARVLTTPATQYDDIARDVLFRDGIGLFVEVEGDLSGGVLVAEEIEPVDD
jgi:hypothetical protein